MPKRPSWLSSREAAALLAVKLETLYAYTSRGLVESVPGPRGRGRRYARASIERLKARHDARSGHGAVAAGALRFGEPTLETSISDIREDGPWYRGHSALELCERNVGFEAVFDLLVTGQLLDSTDPVAQRTAAARWSAPTRDPAFDQLSLPANACSGTPSSLLAAWIGLAALTDDARHGASDPDEHARARRLALWLAKNVRAAATQANGAGHPQSLVQPQSASSARRSARGGRVRSRAEPEVPSAARRERSIAEAVLVALGGEVDAVSVEVIDRTLILCAEHELNASTFACRVAASTGADLYACLGAALHTLTGALHGGASARVEALLREIGSPGRAASVLRERRARGEAVPGFGQPLYPQGDPRGRALFEIAERAAAHRRRVNPQYACLVALAEAMRRAAHPGPNLDAGLVAVSSALDLPPGSAAAFFPVGRIPGWVAHALEQRAQHYILRPRARYVPPSTAEPAAAVTSITRAF